MRASTARARSGTQSTSHSGSGVRRLTVGGATPSRIARISATSSSPAAALMQWPSTDFAAKAGTRRSPNTVARAARLLGVAETGARGVRAHQVHVGGVDPRRRERRAHAGRRHRRPGSPWSRRSRRSASPRRSRPGSALRARARGRDPRAAAAAAPSPIDETVAVGVEGPAGGRRIRVAGEDAGRGARRREHPVERRGAPGDGRAQLTEADQVRRLEDGDGSARARPATGRSGPREAPSAGPRAPTPPFGRPWTIAKASTPSGPSRSSASAVRPRLARATSTPATTPISARTGGCSSSPCPQRLSCGRHEHHRGRVGDAGDPGIDVVERIVSADVGGDRAGRPPASKRRSPVTPERPATRASQNSATELPSGETTPSPVTTTRGGRSRPALGRRHRPPLRGGGVREEARRAPPRRRPRAIGARRSPGGAARRP